MRCKMCGKEIKFERDIDIIRASSFVADTGQWLCPECLDKKEREEAR